jgi:hypothetical protein
MTVHPSQKPIVTFDIVPLFFGEEILALPSPKLEDNPLSAVRD